MPPQLPTRDPSRRAIGHLFHPSHDNVVMLVQLLWMTVATIKSVFIVGDGRMMMRFKM
jgi:hypothetical protein